MLDGAGPGRLVSAYPSWYVRELRQGGSIVFLFVGFLMVAGCLAGEAFLVISGLVVGAFGLLIVLSPPSLPRVHENGLVVHRLALGDAFYPWPMFNHYWVGVNPETEEGNRTQYILVLSVDVRYSVGHPMTDYQAAHRIIEENLVWRPRPRRV
jgi:hypothetical protein